MVTSVSSKRSLAAVSEEENKYGEYVGEFKVSFYTAKCKGCSGKTASGTVPTPGKTVAVDTDYWPLGTKFYVEGFGVVVAEDTGGAINGKYRFDLCVATTKEALQLGVKKLKVYLIKEDGSREAL